MFDGTDCISKMLDWLVNFKREPRKMGNKIVEYETQLKARIESGFDTNVVLNSSSIWHS